MRNIFLPLLLLFCISSFAQNYSNLRVKTVSLRTDTIVLDSVSIVPNSFFIMDNTNQLVDSAAYSVDAVNGRLTWKKNSTAFTSLKEDSLKITYRVFPFLFSQSYQHKDYKKLKSASGISDPFYYSSSSGNPDLFKFEGLTKSGSISRGITFGNNQDVFVNSSLNLQLAGKISEDVEILAAITDENVPVQPEGNTQQLQDFDKVFIQLSNENNKLIAGDFDLKRPDSYFMNFQKKGQGGLFSTKFKLGKSDDPKKQSVMRATVSGAVSKGKFARNVVPAIEGNQGPYRLTGSNGETYIIILAGSEKIFIDGQRMVRGAQNDYIIDYNTAQITFMAKRMVTKDSRIIAEFEYSEKSYARSLIFFNDELEKDKLKIKFNLYSEQDSKNQPLQIELDSAKKAVMDSVGDHIEQAVYPTSDSTAFNVNQILYRKADTTTIGGITYPGIFIYSTNPDSAHWSVTFSIVGQGNGDYVQDINSANGRVYKWVEPVNGIRQGSYAPVALLITPKKQQLFTLGSDYTFSKNNKAIVELALSNNDINLFSSKDKANDAGYAAKVIYENTSPLTNDTIHGLKLKSSLNYEYVNQFFKPLERFRPVEFERDWNVGGITAISDEHISSFQTALLSPAFGSVNYQLKSYLKGTAYKGLMNTAGMNFLVKKFTFAGTGSYLRTSAISTRTQYYKHNLDLSRPVWRLVIGGRENTEHNEFLRSSSDSLFSNSFYFQEYQGYVATLDSAKTRASLSYKQRYDYAPVVTQFKIATVADEINLAVELLKNPNSQLRTTSTYRKLSIRDTTLTQQPAAKTFLNRMDYNLTLWKGVVSSATYYEVGGGQERKLEYSYILTSPGQGSYVWNDYNGDHVQQLNEFEIALFPGEDSTYIKVYTPTDQYINTRTNQFSEVLTLSPAAAMQSVQGTQKLITRFSNQLSVRLDKKTQNEELVSSLNPFNQDVNDTTLVSNNSNVRNTLFFNRSNSVFGMDATWQQNKAKSLLTNGFESRVQTTREINARWNFTHSFLLNANYTNGDKENISEFFSIRDYHIKSNETEPKLSFQPTSSFRTTLSYKYAMKKNVEGILGEKTFTNKFGIEIKYTTVRSGSLLARFSYIHIDFNADENSSLAYDMLEGLHNGKNATWSLSLQRNLSNSVQLSLNYDGRKSEGAAIVHTGGVQFRAFF
jgi:hypothetical protein